MTLSDVSELVAGWQEPLGLTTWDLTIELVASPGDNDEALAACLTDGPYERATLQFADALLNQTPQRVEEAVVHELLHLTSRDLSSAIQDAEEQLGPVAGPMFHNRTLHELEGIVDKVATLLVDFCYSDEECTTSSEGTESESTPDSPGESTPSTSESTALTRTSRPRRRAPSAWNDSGSQ